MNIVKNALRIAARHPIYLTAYLAILTVMGVLLGQLVASDSASSDGYEPARANVAVIDRDGSQVSRAFKAWAGERFDVVEVAGSQDVQDALARSSVDCVFVLSHGLGDRLLAAARAGADLPELEVTYGTNVQRGVLAAQEASSWVSLAGRAAALEPDADAAHVAELAGAAAGERATVKTAEAAEADARAGATGAMAYFKFAAYPIMSAVTVTLGLVLSAFSEGEVARRSAVGPVSAPRRDAALLLASLVLTILVWLVSSAAGLIVFAGELSSIPGVQLAALLGVQLVVSLTPLALAFLFSSLGLREQGLNAAGNIGGMVLTFLGGAWVPLELMGDAVRTVAKFVPTYWSCDAIGLLLGGGTLSAGQWLQVATDAGIAVLFAAAVASIALALAHARKTA